MAKFNEVIYRHEHRRFTISCHEGHVPIGLHLVQRHHARLQFTRQIEQSAALIHAFSHEKQTLFDAALSDFDRRITSHKTFPERYPSQRF